MFLINPDYDYGRQCYNSFLINYKKVVPDFEIVGEVWPKLGTTDFSPYISRILSSGANILCSGLYGGDELKFVKQAVPYGLYKKMHVVEPGAGDTAVWMNVKTADASPVGAISVDRYPWWMLDNPKSKSFANKYREMGKADPNYGAMNQYNIIYALKEAIEAIGAVDTEKIIKYLEDRVFQTALGPIKMRGCDHQAMIPQWLGIVGFGDGLDYPHVINGKLTENIEGTYRPCEEIAKIRKEAQK